MKNYVVIGRGNGNRKVITASLNDLPEDSVFHLLWTGDPTPAEEAVLDWLIDNEKTFHVYGQRKVPAGLSRYAEDVIDSGPMDMLHAVENLGGNTALVLWDEGVEADVLHASTVFPHLLELTNGLAPIEVQGDDDEEEQPTPPTSKEEEKEEDMKFSVEELANMPAAAVKRIAKERGIDISGLTKAEIIPLLQGEDEPTPAPVAESGDSAILSLARQINDIEDQINDVYDTMINPLNEKRSSLVIELQKLLNWKF